MKKRPGLNGDIKHWKYKEYGAGAVLELDFPNHLDAEKFLEQIDGEAPFWLVGKALDEEHPDAWEFQGLYHDQHLALARCHGEPDFWIGPVYLNMDIGSEKQVWPGARFPTEEETQKALKYV